MSGHRSFPWPPRMAAILVVTGAMAGLPTMAADESGSSNQVAGESVCGPVAIPGHYGPYDYTTDQGRLQIVNQFHFTPKVEALIGGESGYLGGDLSYTLNASPNHHRALVAAMTYALRTKMATPPHMRMSVECYFDRATRFRPGDTVVRTLYAYYLGQLGRPKEGVAQLELAEKFASGDGAALHNIGLGYAELKVFDKALSLAHEAARQGHDAHRLEKVLRDAGQWKDATP